MLQQMHDPLRAVLLLVTHGRGLRLGRGPGTSVPRPGTSVPCLDRPPHGRPNGSLEGTLGLTPGKDRPPGRDHPPRTAEDGGP